jgi:hypothetical protein
MNCRKWEFIGLILMCEEPLLRSASVLKEPAASSSFINFYPEYKCNRFIQNIGPFVHPALVYIQLFTLFSLRPYTTS